MPRYKHNSNAAVQRNEVHEQLEYYVERIVATRIRNGKREFCIKWLGYPDEDNTWEPSEHLNCAEAIKDFTAAMFNHTERTFDQRHNDKGYYNVNLCVCRRPWNPVDPKDMNTIECTSCKAWFHPDCVGMSPESAQFARAEGSVFYCPDCRA